MLNNCIFCGAKSAQWPSYASDSASKYNLCHYHMGHLLKMATVEQYTPEQHRLAGKKEKVLSGIFAECRKVLESGDYDRETEDILSEHIITDIYPWTDVCYYDGMTPYLTLDDEDVDREICRRISLLVS